MSNFVQTPAFIKKKMIEAFGDAFPEIKKVGHFPILTIDAILNKECNTVRFFEWVLVVGDKAFKYSDKYLFSYCPHLDETLVLAKDFPDLSDVDDGKKIVKWPVLIFGENANSKYVEDAEASNFGKDYPEFAVDYLYAINR